MHSLNTERRSAQCQQWNADASHQAMGGKARAAQFTSESQATAGHASFAAFSARWRAAQGAPPLFAEAVRRYVLPAMIRGPLGQPLSQELQETVWRAWCKGNPHGVEAWLSDDPPPDPDSLWAQRQPAEGV
jgi:hypothetical protein